MLGGRVQWPSRSKNIAVPSFHPRKTYRGIYGNRRITRKCGNFFRNISVCGALNRRPPSCRAVLLAKPRPSTLHSLRFSKQSFGWRSNPTTRLHRFHLCNAFEFREHFGTARTQKTGDIRVPHQLFDIPSQEGQIKHVLSVILL